MPKSKVACITGANRGIGLEFVRQLSNHGWKVVGGYRDAARADSLLGLAEENDNVTAVEFDTTNHDQLQQLHDRIKDEHGKLHLLVNNAAVNLESDKPINEVSVDALRDSFEINVIGVHLTTEILYPLLAKSGDARVVNIGSGLGSVERSSGKILPYRLSKCALNMLTSAQAEAYRDDGVMSVVVSPGWVRTDMGGSNADLSTEESVGALLKLIGSLTPEDTGQFMNRTGEAIPY